MRPERVELHIEELVLHGFPPRDRYGIAEAIQRELTRLLIEHGVPAALRQGGDVARLDGGSLEVALGTSVETIGIQVARTAYQGMTK
ncbi:MAG TPA: hypothetical protein VFS96_08040 [Nitrolancea sp.]|nr:hypothetical protein [Nitrolancea sp.]